MNAYTKDLGACIRTALSLSPQTFDAGADINGAAVDRSGFYSAVIVVATGAAGGGPTAQSLVFQLEESSTGVDGWEAVADHVVTVTADDSATELDVDLSARKRYLRVTADGSESSFTDGASPSNTISAVVVLGGADSLPV